MGITLTAATSVIFAELHYTPGIMVQAEDRAHRIGRVGDVNIEYLIAPGTADDWIWRFGVFKKFFLNTNCRAFQNCRVFPAENREK